MKRPELIMSKDWPDPNTRRRDLWSLRRALVVTLLWPTEQLPPEMGDLPNAEMVEGNIKRRYFLEVHAEFDDTGVGLSGTKADPDWNYPAAFIDYHQLEQLIRDGDTAVRRPTDPPPSLEIYGPYEPDGCDGRQPTRRYAGQLRVVDDGTPQTQEVHEDIPY